jgi:hypothetical protein
LPKGEFGKKQPLDPRNPSQRPTMRVNCTSPASPALQGGWGSSAASHSRSFQRYSIRQRSAYGERKTARILTGTPIRVNTTKTPVTSRVPMFYQGFSHFKQTFVLDLQGGVDIMRLFEMTLG